MAATSDDARHDGRRPNDDRPDEPKPDEAKSKHTVQTAPGDPGSATVDSDSAGPDAPVVYDEELCAMLEHLGEALDSANSVIAGNHAMAESIAADERLAVDHPEDRARWWSWSGMSRPAQGALVGVFLGVAALALYWPGWTVPEGWTTLGRKHPDRITETVIVRSRPEKPVARSAPVVAAGAGTPGPAHARDQSRIGQTERRTQAEVPAAAPESANITTATAAIAAPGTSQPLGAEETARLMERGKTLIADGDVAGARLVFGYAARRGSADAMFALAQTFDPDQLSQWRVLGLEADVSEALSWYLRAAEAGHEKALARSRKLSGGALP